MHFPTSHVLAILTWMMVNLAGGLHSQAAQVSWNSEANANDTDSSGRPLTSVWVFELGAFTPGFVPTAANTGQWAAQWTTAARTAYDQRNKAVSGPRFTFTTNATPFTTANRGWIWGYNPSGRVQEWILIGDTNWLWPDASAPFTLPSTWAIGVARQTIVGSLRGVGYQMRTATVSNGALPQFNFTAWTALYFTASERSNPALSGSDADADGDGAPNGMEYALGTAPRYAASAPVLRLDGSALRVDSSPVAMGSLSAEISANLIHWSTGTAIETSLANGVRSFVPVEPALFAQKGFWRLKWQP